MPKLKVAHRLLFIPFLFLAYKAHGESNEEVEVFIDTVVAGAEKILEEVSLQSSALGEPLTYSHLRELQKAEAATGFDSEKYVETIASLNFKYFEALISVGFSREEALSIVKTTGIRL